jgi:phosphate-selective porin OprO/OprP
MDADTFRYPSRNASSTLIRFLAFVMVAGGRLFFPPPCSAVEPYFGYYDEVPPVDQGEIDAVAERTREARKRFKHNEIAAAERSDLPDTGPRAPLPPPIQDERDGTPPIDFGEVDELRKAFQSMQAQQQAEEKEHLAVPQGPASSQPPKDTTDREITALTERLNALERVLTGTEERPGLAGLIGGWTRHNGFFLMSSGGDFFLRLPVLIQADYRSFPSGQNGADPGVRPNTFILQRVRPMVHFRLWRYFRGFMTPDLGNGFTANPNVQGRVQTPDAFGEWDYFSAFRVRLGKFKSPIGLEMLQATQNLTFMERSLTRNLLPNRDLGAMVWGMFDHGALEYQIGVFNGVPNANFYSESAATSSGKTMEARLFSRPFLNTSIDALRGFGIGAGMSWGSVRNNNGQDPMQTETFSYTFFQYNNNVTGDGDRTRVSPQVAWYYKRIGLLGQYVLSTQHLKRLDTGVTARTTHDAWSAQLSLFLTEDTATFGRVEPRRPLNPSRGHWGAWEVALRYAQLNIDQDSFALGFADPTIYAQRAKSTTIGLNWYLNTNVRLAGNFVHTDFSGATSAYRAADHENGLLFRAQLVF